MKKQKLLMAAVAGMALGLTAPAETLAQEQTDEVKCYGINGCGSHAKCAVSAQDLGAVKTLLGPKEWTRRFGKSEAHACGAHASCGGPAQILNWVPTSKQECSEQGGILIEEKDGKKIAKKA